MHRRMLTAIVAVPLALSAGALADGGAAPRDPAASARDRLADFFARTKGTTRLIDASDLWASIHAGEDRYVIVDVRPADQYATGHVPGALNMPIAALFRPESLAKLPSREKKIILVCQSGHMESMALGGLVALGYEPWVMRFGMIGWNAETQVRAGSAQQPADAVHGVGGPIEKQAVP